MCKQWNYVTKLYFCTVLITFKLGFPNYKRNAVS